MIKFFKIIEKIVWAIAILAIVAVLAMIFIGAFVNFDKVQIDSYYMLEKPTHVDPVRQFSFDP